MNAARTPRRLCAGLMTSLILVALGAAPALASSLAVPSSQARGACTDESGVTVVVDFTDVGGEIVAGCAGLDPSSGREALQAAGFAITESQPGLICAIDDQPDPCPVTFEGSFWSYWHSSPDGDWASYLMGADSSDPAPGELEGWRYNDGTTGPGLAPADVATLLPPAPSTPTASDAEPAPTAPSVDGALLFWGLGAGALVILAVALLLLRSRQRRASGGGPGAETKNDAG